MHRWEDGLVRLFKQMPTSAGKSSRPCECAPPAQLQLAQRCICSVYTSAIELIVLQQQTAIAGWHAACPRNGWHSIQAYHCNCVLATIRRGAALVHTCRPPHVLDAEAPEQQLRWLRPLGCELQCQRPVWLVVCPPHRIICQAFLVWHLELHACTQLTERTPPGIRSWRVLNHSCTRDVSCSQATRPT